MTVPDHFAVLGLPERFDVDRQEVERRYLALSRELHPDRHATGTLEARRESLERTSALNLAYKVLRDDFLRAEHLLRRRGIETSETESQDNRTTVDRELLMQVLELREGLEEARRVHAADRVAALAEDVRGRAAAAWDQIRPGWRAVEGGDQSALAVIARLVTALRYYRRFLEEVDAIDEEGP